jgi:hypothetical protein
MIFTKPFFFNFFFKFPLDSLSPVPAIIQLVRIKIIISYGGRKMKRTVISRKLWEAIKTADRPAYAIAREAGISSSTLSKLMCDIEPVKDNDTRVIAVGKAMGIPASDCFGVELS